MARRRKMQGSTVVVLAWIVAGCGGKVSSEGESSGTPTVDAGGSNHRGPPQDSGFTAVPPGVDATTVFPPPPLDATLFPDDGTVIVVDATIESPPDTGECMPQTCADVTTSCGTVGDGCGGVLVCGECDPPSTCGGGGEPGVCGGTSVSGTWTGTWVTNPGGLTGSVSMQLGQEGSTVSGAVSFLGEPCFQSAQLTATLAEQSFGGTVAEGANMGSLKASFAGDAMSGGFSITAGTCAANSGTFTATR